MCLHTNDPTIHIAESDMIVYKHATARFHRFRVILETPYQGVRFKVNKLINALNYHGKDIILRATVSSSLSQFTHEVDEGIHSFTSLIDAKNDSDSTFADTHTRKKIVFKCVIPKGTPYVTGNFGPFIKSSVASVASIASEKIIYKKVVYTAPLTFLQKILIFLKCV